MGGGNRNFVPGDRDWRLADRIVRWTIGAVIAGLVLCPQSRAASAEPTAAPESTKSSKVIPAKKRHHRTVVHGRKATHVAHQHQAAPTGSDRQVGLASWYGASRGGRRTASGERLNDGELTAAHLTLPMHSRVRVTNLENGKSVTVRVTDRGPHLKGRIIDVSRIAAEQLDMKRTGIARVEVVPLPRDPPATSLLGPATSGDARSRSRSASAAVGTGLAY